MKCDIVIGGVGGQGILTVAGLIARTALRAGLNIKQSEVHGMAQRGGAVEAHLRLSAKPIFSDLIPVGAADVVCGMEPLEALRQLRFLSAGGWLIASSDPVANLPNYPQMEEILGGIRSVPRYVILPAAQMAKEAGSTRAANVVILGAVSALLPLAEADFGATIAAVFQAKGEAVVAANNAAFSAGRRLAATELGRSANGQR